MNIAVFSHYFTPEIGAPSARIYDLAQQWLRSGHEVQVVTCFPNHPTGRLYAGYQRQGYLREVVEGVDVHRHWTYVTPNKGFLKKSLGHLSYWPASAWFSEPRLDRADVAIGTSPTFFAAMAAQRYARRHHVPNIVEVRDLWPAVFVELGVLRNRMLIALLEMWERSLYRRADRVVTVTEAFRQDLIRRGVPADKVVTIPNGADVDFWHPLERPLDLAAELGLAGKFVVLYIGAHGISQALASIVDAARLLADDERIQFVFVGEGAEKDTLARRASEGGVRNVRFLDPVGRDDVRKYYALADVCLVPLRDIALFRTFIPSKMFEMMAMARPILASLQGEAAEILERSGGAVVVPPEDTAAIAQAIRELAADPERRLAMGQRGRQFVVGQYSRRALAERYVRVIEEAVAGRASRQR